jgi:hypothetical protein
MGCINVNLAHWCFVAIAGKTIAAHRISVLLVGLTQQKKLGTWGNQHGIIHINLP